jgi:hypothetical protein
MDCVPPVFRTITFISWSAHHLFLVHSHAYIFTRHTTTVCHIAPIITPLIFSDRYRDALLVRAEKGYGLIYSIWERHCDILEHGPSLIDTNPMLLSPLCAKVSCLTCCSADRHLTVATAPTEMDTSTFYPLSPRFQTCLPLVPSTSLHHSWTRAATSFVIHRFIPSVAAFPVGVLEFLATSSSEGSGMTFVDKCCACCRTRVKDTSILTRITSNSPLFPSHSKPLTTHTPTWEGT